MYQERKFDTWKEGLIYLAIIIGVPLIPIIIYMVTKKPNDTYLYVLLLTVIFSFCYEFFTTNNNCSKFLKVENIVCCIDLIIMLLYDIFLLIYYAETGKNGLVIADYILVSLFFIPVVLTIVEIIRAIKADIETNKNKTPMQNIANGASNI